MDKKDLKIVFLGTPEFAVESLDRIVNDGYNVVAVVTMPDKPAGRGHNLLQSPVKQYAVSKNIPVLQPVNLKDSSFVDQLRSYGADLFVVIAFRMLPEVVWQMPRLGTFNLHASLLPDYRGAAPINWAVINGDTRTGVTTFFLKHEIDTGDIIDRAEIDILPEDNVGDVHDRLMALGADLTVKTLDSIIKGTLVTVPQDCLVTDDKEPRPAPKIFKDTCHIDWNRPAMDIHNLVRGLSPYPGAWSTIEDDGPLTGKQVKIFETSLGDAVADEMIPGKITVVDKNCLAVDCADRRLFIKNLQLQGKKSMGADEFLRGAKIVKPRLC